MPSPPSPPPQSSKLQHASPSAIPPQHPSDDTSPSSPKPKKPLTAKQAAKLDPSTSSKQCAMCGKVCDVLIRCRVWVDEGRGRVGGRNGWKDDGDGGGDGDGESGSGSSGEEEDVEEQDETEDTDERNGIEDARAAATVGGNPNHSTDTAADKSNQTLTDHPSTSLHIPPQITPNKYHLLCPKPCWYNITGGGIEDGDEAARERGYRYGGIWKNKKGAVSGKRKKGKGKGEGKE